MSVCGTVLTTKAAAGIATAAIVTGSAIEVQQVAKRTDAREQAATPARTSTAVNQVVPVTAVTATEDKRPETTASAATATKDPAAEKKAPEPKAIDPAAAPAAPVATQISAATVGAPTATGTGTGQPIEEDFNSVSLPTDPATPVDPSKAPNRGGNQPAPVDPTVTTPPVPVAPATQLDPVPASPEPVEPVTPPVPVEPVTPPVTTPVTPVAPQPGV